MSKRHPSPEEAKRQRTEQAGWASIEETDSQEQEHAKNRHGKYVNAARSFGSTCYPDTKKVTKEEEGKASKEEEEEGTGSQGHAHEITTMFPQWKDIDEVMVGRNYEADPYEKNKLMAKPRAKILAEMPGLSFSPPPDSCGATVLLIHRQTTSRCDRGVQTYKKFEMPMPIGVQTSAERCRQIEAAHAEHHLHCAAANFLDPGQIRHDRPSTPSSDDQA